MHLLVLSLCAHCLLDRLAHQQDDRDLRGVEAGREHIGEELILLVEEEKEEIVERLDEVLDGDDHGDGIEEELEVRDLPFHLIVLHLDFGFPPLIGRGVCLGCDHRAVIVANFHDNVAHGVQSVSVNSARRDLELLLIESGEELGRVEEHRHCEEHD